MLKHIKSFFDYRSKNDKTVAEEPPHGNRPDDSVQMKALYSLITRYVSRSRIYLDPDLKVNELARAIHTNRLYLSRTINYCSGLNYKQFMNWYRVMHATELMKADSRLKIDEILKMSGFNSQPTFNLAFKYNLHCTPSEYMLKLHKRGRRAPSMPRYPGELPSNFPEQEL